MLTEWDAQGINPNCTKNSRVYGHPSQWEGKGRKMREKRVYKSKKGVSLAEGRFFLLEESSYWKIPHFQ